LKPKLLTPEQEAKAYELWTEHKITIRNLAIRYGIKERSMATILHRVKGERKNDGDKK